MKGKSLNRIMVLIRGAWVSMSEKEWLSESRTSTCCRQGKPWISFAALSKSALESRGANLHHGKSLILRR
jgi:hypothetical protein